MKALIVLLLPLGLVLLDPVSVHPETARGSATTSFHRDTSNMQRIPGGMFVPFLRSNGENRRTRVHAFYLDIHAVTNEEYLVFIKANPAWAKSKVSRLFADGNYLRQWSGDFEIGDNRIVKSPVTNISWFAAEAYCKYVGKRLPTLAEWEYAAAAPPMNNTKIQSLSRIILQWYDHPTPHVLPPVQSSYQNSFGLFDMHGLVWEWVGDFNSVMLQAGPNDQNPAINTLFCGAGGQAAANKEDYAAYMRYAFRESLRATYTVGSLGFRGAKDDR